MHKKLRGNMQKLSKGHDGSFRQFTTKAKITSSPAVTSDGDLICVGSHDGKIYGWNASTGSLKWSFETEGAVHSSPAVSLDSLTVFVGSKDHRIYALYAGTGTLKWVFSTRGIVDSSPLVSSDSMAVAEHASVLAGGTECPSLSPC